MAVKEKLVSHSRLQPQKHKSIVSKSKTKDKTLKSKPFQGVKHKSKPKRSRNNLPRESILVLEKPFWLKALSFLERGSSVFSFFVIGAMLFVYGMSVYVPYEWTQEYRKLKQLQKDERQVIATNEIIKNQLAKQANLEGIGLVDPEPTMRPIILPVTPAKTLELNDNKTTNIKPIQISQPLAY
jgi:hypothetical protein